MVSLNEGVSRDGGAKSVQTRLVMVQLEDAPYIFFNVTPFLNEKGFT